MAEMKVPSLQLRVDRNYRAFYPAIYVTALIESMVYRNHTGDMPLLPVGRAVVAPASAVFSLISTLGLSTAHTFPPQNFPHFFLRTRTFY